VPRETVPACGRGHFPILPVERNRGQAFYYVMRIQSALYRFPLGLTGRGRERMRWRGTPPSGTGLESLPGLISGMPRGGTKNVPTRERRNEGLGHERLRATTTSSTPQKEKHDNERKRQRQAPRQNARPKSAAARSGTTPRMSATRHAFSVRTLTACSFSPSQNSA
jgi:hypothetical protein